MKKLTFLTLLFSLVSLIITAQTLQIKGRVLEDSSAAGLANVSVSVVDGKGGTSTDQDGNFTLSVPGQRSVSLRFSFEVLHMLDQQRLGVESSYELGEVKDRRRSPPVSPPATSYLRGAHRRFSAFRLPVQHHRCEVPHDMKGMECTQCPAGRDRVSV